MARRGSSRSPKTTLRSVARALERSARRTLQRTAARALKAGLRAVGATVDPFKSKPVARTRARALPLKPLGPPPRAATQGPGEWLSGVSLGLSGARRWWLYRPPSLTSSSSSNPAPLLVMLHGCDQDARGFAQATRMNRVADSEGFWVLYPEQDRLANGHRCWNWFDTRNGRAQKEVALIVKAIDDVCRLYPVDADRVAVAGLSAGAGMAALVATAHPDRIRAVVMHAGVPPGRAHSTLSALRAMNGREAPEEPVAEADNRDQSADKSTDASPPPWPPLLVIHGSQDSVVAPANGQAAVQLWARRLGARARPTRTVRRGGRHAMHVTDYRNRLWSDPCVTHIEVEGLAHAWSGGAASQAYTDPAGPDASRLVWSFIRRHWR